MLTKILDKYFENSKITKGWHNPKIRALILLPIWLIFIALIVFYYVIPYEKNNKQNNNTNVVNEEKKETDISILWDNLLSSEYDYEYKILSDDVITYEGTYEGKVHNGTKDDGIKLTTYMVDENGDVYIINDGEAIFHNNIDSIFGTYYLKIENLYNELKTIAYTKENNQYFYEKDNLYVIIDTDNDIISSISISINEEKYILKFYNFR